jgi:hypothetical protein
MTGYPSITDGRRLSFGIISIPGVDDEMMVVGSQFDLVVFSIGGRARRCIADAVLIAK